MDVIPRRRVEVEQVKTAALWLAVSAAAAAGAASQLVDVSYDAKAPQKRQAVRFRANDVLLIEVPNGPRAAVQFTELAARRGSYRWRFRRPGSTEVVTGTGTVAEKYEDIPDGPGRGHMLPLPGHDTIVRAGDIRAAWSWADWKVSYLYFHPRRATVKVLPAESFDQQP
jgi:hypothetical protein